jgi:hypothetical protein
MTTSALPLTYLAPGVVIGGSPPDGWQSVAARPLLVMVGVTGVGKSTTLDALNEHGFAYHLLPDRRDLTDRLIIPAVQAAAGMSLEPVKDRKLRFEYTRTYREQNPGGMAHALAQLRIDPNTLPDVLLFDGLRGAGEVEHAAVLLPAARFVVLEARDVVRVSRLMGRGDPFDQIGGENAESAGYGQVASFGAIGIPEADGAFSPLETQALLELVRTGSATPDALRSALAIVLEERRNYDPAAAAASLRRIAPARTLVVDTERIAPQQVAAQTANFAADWITQ